MDILLDSGAFSAFNLGKCIDLDDYIGFVKATIASSIAVSISM